ncbi:MAG TPA: GNAT family N-acetyltransferase [Candidatus Wallbacteria bacterium]|nr:MAG: TDP-fucosamine acetyltransferase [bacterium ADurb.Bin243]HOD39858.1 GNAT family N-acetyltransferase [Candidatus Wallbacteria bacterium]HPG57998.1 GNAT family N-acetyltransferase [Candidatus Wallbacteria bacterium]
MNIDIIEESVEVLPQYALIPISFQVETVFRVEAIQNGLGGFLLHEEKLEKPYAKDYDAHPGEGPAAWARQWDISNWQVLSAYADKKRIGGALVAYHTEGLNFLDGRKDAAALWDIRIHPEFRGLGAGAKLFQGAVECAKKRDCVFLKIETQNNNVSACKFYASRGCELGAINTFAYREFPDETQLIWYKRID